MILSLLVRHKRGHNRKKNRFSGPFMDLLFKIFHPISVIIIFTRHLASVLMPSPNTSYSRMKSSKPLLSTLATIVVLAITIFLPSAVVVVVAQEKDNVAECEGWAAAGECNLNPRYMLEHCPIACAEQAELDKQMAEAIGECFFFLRYYVTNKMDAAILIMKRRRRDWDVGWMAHIFVY